MPTIILETVINAPIGVVFQLAGDIDLHILTTSGTKEKAIAGRTSGSVQLGDMITFEAVHFGFKQRLTSKITAFDPPTYFMDEMQKGTFKSLQHEHFFKAINEGITLMTDKMHFESPFGFIGKIVNKLILTRYMRKFLQERNAGLKRIIESGEWKNLVKKPVSY